MYVKLVDGDIINAPERLVLEDGYVITNFNRSISAMLEYGFRPLLDTKPNYDVDTQYCNFVRYVDTGRHIRCEWEIVDIEIPESELQNQDALKAMEMLNMDFHNQLQTLSDAMALEVPLAFPKWESGLNYTSGFKLRHNGILYKVIQTHTSQSDWAPDISPSLFAKVIVGEDKPLEWVQPDSTNAYMSGDKVIFNGEVYESTINNNVWSPATYPAGWKLVEG